MDEQLLRLMRCPYCDGELAVSRRVRGDGNRLLYGLIDCRCFSFPVVAGILLLSLAKGYGGAEEELQPYVPLQVAAVEFLERDDVAGLLRWIDVHAPFVSDLIRGTTESYLDFTARLNKALDAAVQRFLDDAGRFEVVGRPRPSLRKLAARVRSEVRARRSETPVLPDARDYYAARFFSPRASSMALQFSALPHTDRLLSLCCGHGVFENILVASGRTGDAVSIDGQLLNLLITRTYADHGGSFICHDIQYPLPFVDGTFDGVVSSTCLPEIPAQKTFCDEAIRVTAPSGWTWFDSIWNVEMSGVTRINGLRHYRFCQNFFSTLDDYGPFFRDRVGAGRRVAVNVPDAPGHYVDDPHWSFDEISAVIAARQDPSLNFLVVGNEFGGLISPDQSWIVGERLAISLAYDVHADHDTLRCTRRPQFASLDPNFAPTAFAGYAANASVDVARVANASYAVDLFTDGVLALSPRQFSGDRTRFVAGRRPAATS